MEGEAHHWWAIKSDGKTAKLTGPTQWNRTQGQGGQSPCTVMHELPPDVARINQVSGGTVGWWGRLYYLLEYQKLF